VTLLRDAEGCQAIGGLLSTKDKVLSGWRKLHNSLNSKLKSNPDLTDITKILSFSYQDPPYNLKACFLYFGMFPEDYFVSCARLIRLWIAEGFVKEEQGMTLEEGCGPSITLYKFVVH
jgi:disease resistance protein RPM1